MNTEGVDDAPSSSAPSAFIVTCNLKSTGCEIAAKARR